MITVVSLVNIHHLIQIKNKRKKKLFLVMRNFRIHTVSQFYIEQAVALSIFIMKWKWKLLSLVWLFVTPWTKVLGILQARILKWVVIPFSKGIFPTLGLNPGLPQCRQILYQLSHKGSLRMLEWVAYPFSSGSSQPRIQPGVSCIAGGFLPTELSGRLPLNSSICS